MNKSLITKLTLSTSIALASSLAIATSASAERWNIEGIFEDGGILSGTFDFDETLDAAGDNPYSDIFITTTAGSSTKFGSVYDSSNDSPNPNDSIFGDSSGFFIEDDTEDFALTINFESSLTSGASVIALDITFIPSQEEEVVDPFDNRLITSGTVTSAATAVPFGFSPTLGLLVAGGVWGISYLKKKR